MGEVTDPRQKQRCSTREFARLADEVRFQPDALQKTPDGSNVTEAHINDIDGHHESIDENQVDECSHEPNSPPIAPPMMSAASPHPSDRMRPSPA